jgi:hypothetical protein
MKFTRYISLISLIVSNLIPLFGVMWYGWSIFSLMFLYWSENVVIGFFTVLKMFFSKGGSVSGTSPELKAFFIPFFVVHFGLFTLVHGIFVIILFHSLQFNLLGVTIGFLSICLSHLTSFMTNFISKGEYLKQSPESLFFSPYKRVIVMHLTVIFGAIFVLNNYSFAAVVILVVLKTVTDLASHIVEHSKIVVSLSHD